MNRLFPILILIALLAGCQHPDGVYLTPGPTEEATQMEITPIAGADTTTPVGSLDSTAILPTDQARFGAYLTLNRVVEDFAVLGVRQITTREFTTVFFADKNRPVSFGQWVFGYFGIKLDSVAIDALPLSQVPHLIPVPIVGNITAGYSYARELTGVYTPGRNYVWRVVSGGAAATIGIQAPANLAVLSPIGGAKILRTRPLELRWTGAGNLTIVISKRFPLVEKNLPLFSIRPTLNTGRLVLEPRVLALLPAGHQSFVLTFILSNRNEQGKLAGYPAQVLAQASSVYNCYVELQ